jgi:hypothetical protein
VLEALLPMQGREMFRLGFDAYIAERELQLQPPPAQPPVPPPPLLAVPVAAAASSSASSLAEGSGGGEESDSSNTSAVADEEEDPWEEPVIEDGFLASLPAGFRSQLAQRGTRQVYQELPAAERVHVLQLIERRMADSKAHSTWNSYSTVLQGLNSFVIANDYLYEMSFPERCLYFVEWKLYRGAISIPSAYTYTALFRAYYNRIRL